MSRLSDRASAAAGRLHAAYRRTGADLPGGDPLRAHGVAMEGYFWRFSDAATGRAVIALVGVNRDARGESWALVGLGAWPGRSLGLAVAPTGWASPSGLQVRADDEGRRIFRGDERRVEVDLGAQGRLAVEVSDPLLWSAAPGRSLLGGSSIFQAVPALNQYWHPWLLSGRASGRVPGCWVVGHLGRSSLLTRLGNCGIPRCMAKRTGAQRDSQIRGGGGRHRVSLSGRPAWPSPVDR